MGSIMPLDTSSDDGGKAAEAAERELRRRRRSRNYAVGVVLMALVGLLYAITLVKFRAG